METRSPRRCLLTLKCGSILVCQQAMSPRWLREIFCGTSRCLINSAAHTIKILGRAHLCRRRDRCHTHTCHPLVGTRGGSHDGARQPSSRLPVDHVDLPTPTRRNGLSSWGQLLLRGHAERGVAIRDACVGKIGFGRRPPICAVFTCHSERCRLPRLGILLQPKQLNGKPRHDRKSSSCIRRMF